MTTKRLLSPIVYRPAFGCSPCSSGFWLDILLISNENSFEWLHLSHLSWLLLFVDTSSYLHLIEGEGERLDVHVIVTRNLFLFVHWVRAKYCKVLFASRSFGFWVFCCDILVAPSFLSDAMQNFDELSIEFYLFALWYSQSTALNCELFDWLFSRN